MVLVHGVIVAHYDASDRTAEEYAMLTLFSSGYAVQDEIARAFGLSARSLRCLIDGIWQKQVHCKIAWLR